MAQTILILGAGIGGIVAAERLRRRLPKEHRIVLVDRERTHVFSPSLLWLMTGDRKADAISRPLARIERRDIDLVRGEIESIDPSSRSTVVSGRKLQADYLIIALGAELAPESVPGLPDSGHNFYTLAGAEDLRTALERFTGGRVIVLTASHPYRCPAAPYEAAMLIEHALRRHGVREQTELRMFAAEPGPMGVAGPEVSAAVRRMIEAKGIGYFPDHVLREADPEQRRL
jgi:sulfide:quinone oxidoreductase